jgi:DNA primase
LYSSDKIEEVARATDLVALVSLHVDLKRGGVNSWKGLCPFHSEKTPSFTVSPDKGFFHCFGCGVGGDAIKFQMLVSGQSFPEALRELAGRAGVSLPAPDGRDSDPSRPTKAALHEVMKAAQAQFRAWLLGDVGRIARRYLRDRGIGLDIAEQYGLGLAVSGWDHLHRALTRQGFSPLIQREAGLIKERGGDSGGWYDLFRGRIMIPVSDLEGRPTAFAGRTFLPEAEEEEGRNVPKYVNSPATDIYSKGRLLFGLQQARPHIRVGGLAFLVEGYFDLISLAAAGVKPVAAVMGTALTQQQVNLLKGQAKEVFLLFDGDEAGQKAAVRALPLLFNAELDGRVMILPDGHDPDSFIRRHGVEAFYDEADRAPDLADFYVARLKAVHPDSLGGQARMIREVKETLAQVPDEAKGHVLRLRLAESLGLTPELLPLGAAAGPAAPLRRAAAAASSPSAEGVDPLARHFLRHVIIHPECAVLLTDELAEAWPQDRTKPLFDQLRAQWLADGALNPGKLRLDDDSLSSLVSEAALSERTHGPQESATPGREFARKIVFRADKLAYRQLSQAVRQAEASGDRELVKRLVAGLKG